MEPDNMKIDGDQHADRFMMKHIVKELYFHNLPFLA